MGLVEDGWLETLGAVNPADLVYQDFVTVGRQLAAYLRVSAAARSARTAHAHGHAGRVCIPT